MHLEELLASGVPSILTGRLWAEVESQYNAPHRHYHAFSHVIEVGKHWLAVQLEAPWERPNETFSALVFHDLIYELSWQPGDSEDMSARIARMVLVDAGSSMPALDSGYDPIDIDYVDRLIRLTAKLGRLKADEVSPEEARFLDCDQAILGSDEDTYDAHLEDLEQEYVPVKGLAYFRMRRLGYVKKMLERSRLFLSDYFAERFETIARGNLARERVRLERGEARRPARRFAAYLDASEETALDDETPAAPAASESESALFDASAEPSDDRT